MPFFAGLEVFDTPHPMEHEAQEQVLDVYFAARKGDGEAGGGAAREGRWIPGFAQSELDTSANQPDSASAYDEEAVDLDEPINIALMLGDMAVFASGGVLPSASHRVTCAWPTDVSVRFALVFSMYGADTAFIEPAAFRKEVCGLPSWDRCPAGENARDSRSQKLYLDYTAQQLAEEEAAEAALAATTSKL